MLKVRTIMARKQPFAKASEEFKGVPVEAVDADMRADMDDDLHNFEDIHFEASAVRTLQVVADEGTLKLRVSNTEGYEFEKYIGGLDIDFGSTLKAKEKAEQIARILLS